MMILQQYITWYTKMAATSWKMLLLYINVGNKTSPLHPLQPPPPPQKKIKTEFVIILFTSVYCDKNCFVCVCVVGIFKICLVQPSSR